MHQPKRGLANVMLADGADISADVQQMYDISGWSHRLLWGATVDVVADQAPRVPVTPVTAAAPTGGVAAPPGADLALRLADGKDVRAVNALLAQGLPVHRQDDGSVVVPASARQAVLQVADRFGVEFTRAESGDRGPLLHRPVIAAAVAADELAVLRELGFEVRPVSTDALNAGFDLARTDLLYVSSGLSYSRLTPAARQEVDSFLSTGGVVTRGTTGTSFNTDAGLLDVSAAAGRRNANGVVAVTKGQGPVATGTSGHAFVYSPIWFTDLGSTVAAEQLYGPGNPLVAGHWAPDENGRGPEAAAGSAAVVSGVADRGTRTVLFGTEPLFRDHPKGSYAQVASAVFWAGG
jgi:hypothetical protein